MIQVKRLANKPLIIAAALATLLAVVTTRQALYLSADPVTEKDCSPLVPLGEVESVPVASQSRSVTSVSWAQQGGSINDFSCLNRTHVYGIVEVKDTATIRRALSFARDNDLSVSIAGARHSQGGQAFAPDSVVLDMRQFNEISLDAERRIVTIQSGATWHDIQNVLHPAFAVKAMQSTDIFTVGGSISVNAHGMDHRAGSVGRTVRAMRVMLADGTIQTLSRTRHPELFNLVVGGYGLFGIILDADIEVTDNRVYRSERRTLDYADFPALFDQEIVPDESYALMYGHLSTAPQSFLREMLLYTYREVDAIGAEIPPLQEVSSTRLRRLVFNLSKYGPVAMRLKWWAEKYIEPRLEACTVSLPQPSDGANGCFVSRNGPMHDSVEYLMNDFEDETDILHEYYVPRHQFMAFVDGLRRISLAHDANLLNASVRVVHREDNFLNYAPTDMFAIVLYLNQSTDADGTGRMARLTSELIDLTLALNGRFFLPYQLHYTAEQLERSYPEVGAFFEAKNRFDPDGLFTNTFYEKYEPLVERQTSF